MFFPPAGTKPNSWVSERTNDVKATLETLGKTKLEDLEKMVLLFKNGNIAHSYVKLPSMEWVLGLKKAMANTSGDARKRLVIRWTYSQTPDICSWAGSNALVGQILEKVQKGRSADDIKKLYENMMKTYRQSQAAPTETAFDAHTKIVRSENLFPSLKRRVAFLEDITDTLFVNTTPQAQTQGALSDEEEIMGRVKLKQKKDTTRSDFEINAGTMTMTDFIEKILPTAKSVQILVPEYAGYNVALTAPVDPKCVKLLFTPGQISHFFSTGGAFGSMRERVEAAGGNYQNAAIRSTIMWGSINDLDNFARFSPKGVHPESGSLIYYGNPNDGYLKLDVDANRYLGSATNKPVENIVAQPGFDRSGVYSFFLKGYRAWNKKENNDSTPDTVIHELKVGDQFFHKEFKYSVDSYAEAQSLQVRMCTIEYQRGKPVETPPGYNVGAYVATKIWGQKPNTWVDVAKICYSPNLWGDCNNMAAGRQVFFLVEGCELPTQFEGNLGFLNTHIDARWNEIRRSLAGFARDNPVKVDPSLPSACGYGFSFETEGEVTELRVTTQSGVVQMMRITKF